MIIDSPHLYQEGDASELFEKIMEKLDLMREGNVLNLRTEIIPIEWDRYKEDSYDDTTWKERTIGYCLKSYTDKDFFKFALYKTPTFPLRLEVFHQVMGYMRFYFPLNNKYVKRDPIGFLTIWMKIAVSDKSLKAKILEFDKWIEGNPDKDFDDKVANIQTGEYSRHKEFYYSKDGESPPPSFWALRNVFADRNLMNIVREQQDTPELKHYEHNMAKR